MMYPTQLFQWGLYAVASISIIYTLLVSLYIRYHKNETPVSHKKITACWNLFIATTSFISIGFVILNDGYDPLQSYLRLNILSEQTRNVLIIYAATRCIEYMETLDYIFKRKSITFHHVYQRLTAAFVCMASIYLSMKSGRALVSCALINMAIKGVICTSRTISVFSKKNSDNKEAFILALRIIETVGGGIMLRNAYDTCDDPYLMMNIKLMTGLYISYMYFLINSFISKFTNLDDIDTVAALTPVVVVLVSPMVLKGISNNYSHFSYDDKLTWAVSLLGSMLLPVFFLSVILAVMGTDLLAVFSPVAYMWDEVKLNVPDKSGFVLSIPYKDGRMHYDQEGGLLQYYRRVFHMVCRYSAYPISVCGSVVLCNRLLGCKLCPFKIVAWINVSWLMHGVLRGTFSSIRPVKASPVIDNEEEVSTTKAEEDQLKYMTCILEKDVVSKRRASVGECLSSDENAFDNKIINETTVRRRSAEAGYHNY